MKVDHCGSLIVRVDPGYTKFEKSISDENRALLCLIRDDSASYQPMIIELS